MIIVMQHGASAAQIAAAVSSVEGLGYKASLIKGEERTIIGVVGDDRPIDRSQFETLDGVEKTMPVLKGNNSTLNLGGGVAVLLPGGWLTWRFMHLPPSGILDAVTLAAPAPLPWSAVA